MNRIFKSHRKTMLSCALLLCLTFCGAAHAVDTEQEIDAAQISVSLVPDKTSFMLGEPIYLSFIVENHSKQDLQIMVGGDYRNECGRPESFKLDVTKDDGTAIPELTSRVYFGGLFGPQKIPAQGEYVFKLFLPSWLKLDALGKYSISARRTLQLFRAPSKSRDWTDESKATKIAAQAETQIEVVARDDAKMGVLIANLGAQMLNRNSDTSGLAVRSLDSIHDARVIPYFVKAFDSGDYSLQFAALEALARFNDVAAFEVLKKGTEAKWDDNIRHTAAYALSRSPNPQALPFLISLRGDKYYAVRLTVLQTLGDKKHPQAIAILRVMANDENKIVSDEAKRYLKLLSEKTD